MIKSIANLRRLNEEWCVRLNADGTLTAIQWDEKTIPEGVLIGQTPRVRLLGKRMGDEKSMSFKDMKPEFSWWTFPLSVFYCDGKVALNDAEYEVTNMDCILEHSNTVW